MRQKSLFIPCAAFTACFLSITDIRDKERKSVCEREAVISSKDYGTKTFVVPSGLHADILKNQSKKGKFRATHKVSRRRQMKRWR